MKNSWKKKTSLAVLCAAASMSAQAEVFDFTDGTYLEGNLNNNPGWVGGGDNYVVTSSLGVPLGVVVPDTAGNNAIRYAPAVKAPEYTVGVVFHFSETAAPAATDYRPVIEFGLFVPGTEALNFRLNRRDNANVSGYQAVMTRGADTNGSFKTGVVAASELGLDFANGDADSDRLYFTYTIVKGVLPENNWTATTRLYNLDTDPDIENPILSQNNLSVNPSEMLWGEELFPFMNNIASKESGDMAGLTIESFTFVAEPDPEPGTPGSIDVDFTAAEGYTDGPMNGPWSGSLNSFTVDSSGTGTAQLSPTDRFLGVTHDTRLPINDLYTLGMEFSFNRQTGSITDNNNALVQMFLGDGSSAIQFALSRQDGIGEGTLYKLKSYSNTDLSPNRFANSDTFSEVLLGFADAEDNASDQLLLEATVVRGASNSDWTTTFVLRNLTQDTDVFAWERPGTFYLFDSALFSLGMSINEDDTALDVSNRVVDRLYASAFTPAPPAGFAVWITGFDLDPADQDSTGDPDNDGLNNLLEFVLNGNPSVSDSSILPEFLVTTTDFEYTYQRRDDSVSPETTQTFQWGTTLATWPSSAVIPAASGADGVATITVSAGVPDDGITDTVTISIPKTEDGGAGKLFGRLLVTEP
jgi:hypothetical protein